MLDQSQTFADVDQSPVVDDVAPKPLAGAKKCSSNVLLVWMRWSGESIPFVRAVRMMAGRDKFRLVDAERTSDASDVWLCRFEETEMAPDLEARSHSLLHRLTSIAPWSRAERVFLRKVDYEEDADEHLWEAFARRPLP